MECAAQKGRTYLERHREVRKKSFSSRNSKDPWVILLESLTTTLSPLWDNKIEGPPFDCVVEIGCGPDQMPLVFVQALIERGILRGQRETIGTLSQKQDVNLERTQIHSSRQAISPRNEAPHAVYVEPAAESFTSACDMLEAAQHDDADNENGINGIKWKCFREQFDPGNRFFRTSRTLFIRRNLHDDDNTPSQLQNWLFHALNLIIFRRRVILLLVQRRQRRLRAIDHFQVDPCFSSQALDVSHLMEKRLSSRANRQEFFLVRESSRK